MGPLNSANESESEHSFYTEVVTVPERAVSFLKDEAGKPKLCPVMGCDGIVKHLRKHLLNKKHSFSVDEVEVIMQAIGCKTKKRGMLNCRDSHPSDCPFRCHGWIALHHHGIAEHG